MANKAIFEEGSEIVVDTEVEAPAAGWTLNHVSVVRTGPLVAVHIEATNNAGAAALVTTLQADFAPPETVTDASGTFTIAANGQVSFTGSTAAGARRVCQLVYAAGAVSP